MKSYWLSCMAVVCLSLYTSIAFAQLPAPTSVTTSVDPSGNVQLSWTQVPMASGYNIYRNNTLVAQLNGGGNINYLDDNPVAGQISTYCVAAVSGGSVSIYSNCIIDSTFYQGGIVASDDIGGDSVIHVSWSVGGNCLITPGQNDIFLEIRNNTTGNDIHTEVIKYADLDSFTTTASLRLNNRNHLLLDSNYNGSLTAVQLTQLGQSIDIYEDYAVIGAPKADNDTGAAFIYKKVGGQWQLDTKLRPNVPLVSDTFGYAVAIHGNRVIVGAPGGTGRAYIFEKAGGVWNQTYIATGTPAQVGDGFGRSVTIDSFTALVGAPNKYTDQGAMFYYHQYLGDWYRLARLVPPTAGAGQEFAYSLQQFDNFLIVGAPGYNGNMGRAYIYEHVGFTWYFRSILTPPGLAAGNRFGSSVSLYTNRAVVGSPGFNNAEGRISVFDRQGAATNWPHDVSFWPNSTLQGDEFGAGVAVYDNTIAIAAPKTADNGTVFLYEKGFGWTLIDSLTRPAGLPLDFYGAAIALDADDLLVGAPEENNGQGKVYTYQYDGSQWVHNGTIGDLDGPTMTVEFWVNRLGPQGGAGTLIADDNVALNMRSNSKNQLNYSVAGGPPVYFNYTLPVGRWTHLAVVVDSASNTSKLYINGHLEDEVQTTTLLGIQRFGYQAVGPDTNYVNALVRDIRYWTLARSANQIQSAFDQQLSGSETGLAGYWKLDEGSGNSLVDASGHYHLAQFKPALPVIWDVDSLPVSIIGGQDQYVGADRHYEYQLKTYATGYGNQLCNTYKDSGSTVPYIEPVIAVDTTQPDSVLFTWTNYSGAVSFYRVFRSGKLLGTIDSTRESYKDVYRYKDSTSLENGRRYNYCFLPFSTRFLTNGQTTLYDSLCIEGATRSLSLNATDDAFPNKVILTWRQIGSFSDALIITRDGDFFAQLDSHVTTYTDNHPVFGKKHKYELQVFNNGKMRVSDSDIGSVPSVGVIAGRVVTKPGHYAVEGLTVRIFGAVGGDTIIRTQQTGLTGDFRFDEVYYGTGTSYRVTVDTVPQFPIITKFISASLTDSIPMVNDLLLYCGKEIAPTGTQALTLSNFNAAVVSGEDKVRLTWNYGSPDSTWFKIFRDNQLITILTDTNTTTINEYVDLDVVPNDTNQYRLVAYVYDSDSVVTEVSARDTIILEPLTPVDTLFAVVDTLAGSVTLSWSHTSTNINGFALYRNGIPIAQVGVGDTYSYEDLEGVPGKDYTYSIRVFAAHGDSVYYSMATNADLLTYPELPTPSNVMAVAQASDETVLISWEYPQVGNVNYYGFQVTRIDQLTMDTVDIVFIHQNCYTGTAGPNYQFSHIDRRGVPGRNYSYEVRTVKWKPLYYSNAESDIEVFPAIQPVNSFTASDNLYDSWISMEWTDACDNHDGYVIQRNSTDLAFLARSAMSHIDGLLSQAAGATYSYEIFPYRMVDDSMYVSANGVADDGSISPVVVPTSPPVIVPQNLQASDNYSGHIQVSWTYPVYSFSTFFIYRDGVFMDSLDNSLRYWYDTTAVEGVTYTYSMRAKFMGDWSGYTSDPGTLRPKMQVEGVAQSQSGFGIPDALIEVSIGGEVLYHTYTDSSGFYRIAGMTKDIGALVTVDATGPNASFIKPSQNFTIESGKDRYQVNFIDTTYQKVIPAGEGIAEITNFFATIDPLTNKVNISWNLSSTNFTGVKLYRELGPIADVTYAEPKFFLDEVAAPGFRYRYRIQAYWILPTGTVLSDDRYYDIGVPPLAPVEALQAIPDKQEDVITLYWSHPTDNHSYYQIRRNGIRVAQIPTGTRMSYTDTSGLPGRNYKYTVTCFEVGVASLDSSLSRRVNTKFPNVAPPDQITLVAYPNDNHVTVEWNHTSVHYDYATVYRYTENNKSPVPLDTIYKNELKYFKDYWGSPLDTNWYQVTATVEKEGIFYESDPATEWIIYPELRAPEYPVVTVGADQISFSGDYLALNGYTGYKFFRNGVERSRKSGLSPTYYFEDGDAHPDSSYVYGIAVFKNADGLFHSDTIVIDTTFPSLSPPTACVASDGIYFNHVGISWEYPSGANTGFIIFRDGVALDTIGSTSLGSPTKSGAGLRKYQDIINTFEGLPDQYTYEIQAYQIRDSVWHLSDKSNADIGWAGIQRFGATTSSIGSSGDKLGTSVSIEPEYAVAGTGSNLGYVQTYALIAGNYAEEQVINPVAASGSTPNFGFSVSTTDSQYVVGAPLAWGNPGNQAGEVYIMDRVSNGPDTVITIVRNADFLPQTKPVVQNFNTTLIHTVQEDSATQAGINYYDQTLEWGPFAINLPENQLNLDIRLEQISLSLAKSGVPIQILNARVITNQGSIISLFKTDDDPVGCPQDTIDVIFPRTGAQGTFEATAPCNEAVAGVYSPLSELNAFNATGHDPSDQYRLAITVRLFDTNNVTVDTFSSAVHVDNLTLNFVTLPGGIHQPIPHPNSLFGYSVAFNGTTLVGGAPGASGNKGEARIFTPDSTGYWLSDNDLIVPAELQCGYFRVRSEWTQGTETEDVEWELNALATPSPPFNGKWYEVLIGRHEVPTVPVLDKNIQLNSSIFPYGNATFDFDVKGGSDDVYVRFSVWNGGTLMYETEQQADWGDVDGVPIWCVAGTHNMGHSVVMSQNQLLVGLPQADAPKVDNGLVFYYRLNNNNNWVLQQQFGISDPGEYDRFGSALAMDDEWLAVGAERDDRSLSSGNFYDAGSVSLFQYDSGDDEFALIENGKIWNPDGSQKSYERFGYAVTIRDNLLAVGAPGVDGPNGEVSAGAVYIYEKNEDDEWLFKERYFAPDPQPGAGFGKSLDLAGNTLMVGAPDFDGPGGTDNGKVYFIYVRDQITEVIASDGTEGNKTRVSWEYEGISANLNGFNVYRDSSLIATADPNKTFIFDYDGIPGKEYVYQVRTVSLDNVEGLPKGDIGWSAPNGILDGTVVTLPENNPVSGVHIEAWANVEGEVYRYTAQTNIDGEYKIKDIYYGDSARYFASAFLLGHEFDPDTQSVELNLQQNTWGLDPFYDLTAYTVSGVVVYAGTECPIDSITVRQIKVSKDGTRIPEEQVTDASGRYQFNIDPQDPNIASYEYEIDSIRISYGVSNDTTYYNFTGGPSPITNFAGLDRNTDLPPYEETTTYPVHIAVRTVCGPIDDPNPHQWRIMVKSVNGCYEQELLTDGQGRDSINIPPGDYRLRVISATNPNTTILTATDYLKVRPRKLDLLEFHTSLKGEKSDTIVQFDFIFHVTPRISMPDLTGFLCGDPNLPVVIQQGEDYSYSVTVDEWFGQFCPVNEGYLMIRNDAARTTPTRIDYNPDVSGFDSYTFTAGPPNPVSPHVKWMFVEYHTEADGFLGELPVAFIIEGVAAVPGADIFVNPDSDDEQLLLPLYVLRDPPGDGSSSKIDSGATIEASLSSTSDHDITTGLNFKTSVKIFNVGVNVSLESSLGGGVAEHSEYKVTMNTTKSFSTSSNSKVDNATNTGWLTGTSADVLVGAGVALDYGIAREIRVREDDTCAALSLRKYTTGAEIKTSWIYTIDQITNLIRGYNEDIERAKNGLLQIDNLSQDEVIDFLTVRRDNWEQMLHYHAVETLPHYQLCNPASYAHIPEPWRSIAAEWRKKGFCERIGSYSTRNGQEVFELKPDTLWKWDTDLLNRYNLLKQAVRNMDFFQVYPAYSDALLFGTNLDAAYAAAYGPDAKNITFSGGTSYSESRSVSKSKGSSVTQKVKVSNKIGGGPAQETSITMYLGTWAGIGGGPVFMSDVTKPIKSNSDWNVYVSYTFNYTDVKAVSSSTNQSISYTLSDDDPGDQYSVTVVNGVNPNHTPFFALKGGRSSCPAEPGAISRDDCQIMVLDPLGGPPPNKTQYNLDPQKTIRFPLQLANLNPFGEGRWYEVYVRENTNLNGATVKLGSVVLHSGGATGTGGALQVFIPAEESIYANLYIDKGPFFYDYEGLQIAMRPVCDPYIVEFIELNLYYRHPCSDISIIQPADGWVINDASSDLSIYMADYDPFNSELQRVQLMYRRKGQGTPVTSWDTIIALTSDSLRNFYNRNKPTYASPTYPVNWDVPANLPDGEYELMAQAYCGVSGIIQSNRVPGTISRSGFKVLGLPEPADGLLSLGDEISVSYNRQIDCPKSMNTVAYSFRLDSPNGPIVDVEAGCFGNKMIFVIDSVAQYEGRMVYAKLDSVYDLTGNRQYEAVEWSFEISNNPVYWYPRALEVTVERGTEKTVVASLYNTGAGAEAYSLSNNYAWLSPQVLAGVVPPAGEPVNLHIDARNVGLGTYLDTVVADITGFTEEMLPVIVHVIKPLPKWTVDPANYQHNISVIARPRIDNIFSTDTMDVITAWIDGEFRGSGRLRKVGANYYASYITVHGNGDDANKEIDFRVWDASVGAEFQGHPAQSVIFTADNAVWGSTPSPIPVNVNSAADSLRYIPLQAGWNWFSLNVVLPDMSLNNVFKSLTLDPGDVIMDQSRGAEYLQNQGWWPMQGQGNNPLNAIDTRKGYLLHLQHADTLRIAGTDAFNALISLVTNAQPSGWNLIGYTPQRPWPIDTAFVNVSPLFENDDLVKSQTEFAIYNQADERWEGSLTTLRPYQAYKVRVGQPRSFNYRSGSVDDWEVEATAFEHAMRVVASIQINGFEFRDEISKVAAFVDGECRGVGTLEYIEPLQKYRAEVMIYSNDPGEEVTFKFWDGYEDTIYQAVQTLTYDPEALVGDLVNAFVVSPTFVSSGTDIEQPRMQSTFEVFPNPFRHELMLTIDEPQGGDYTVTMYNGLGQQVLEQHVTTVKGPNRVYLQPGQVLASGMYQITIRRDDAIIETLRVIRQ